MASTNEYINYEQVRQGADEMRQYAARIEEIFKDSRVNMEKMASDWKGKASDTVQTNWDELAANFHKYVETVERFANLFSNAATTIEEGEFRMKQQAEKL